jgi:hypothetical protein
LDRSWSSVPAHREITHRAARIDHQYLIIKWTIVIIAPAHADTMNTIKSKPMPNLHHAIIAALKRRFRRTEN